MSTTLLSIIGYSFTLTEMLTIPDINCRIGYAAGCFVGIYPGELPGTPEPHPEAVGKKAVFIETELALRLSDEEYHAVFLHEEGHAACGHIERLMAGEALGVHLELEADRYAIKHGADPKALRRGVEKAVQLASERLTLTGRNRWFRALVIRCLTRWSKEYRARVQQMRSF